jgi:hypothetical protein
LCVQGSNTTTKTKSQAAIPESSDILSPDEKVSMAWAVPSKAVDNSIVDDDDQAGTTVANRLRRNAFQIHDLPPNGKRGPIRDHALFTRFLAGELDCIDRTAGNGGDLPVAELIGDHIADLKLGARDREQNVRHVALSLPRVA